MPFKVGDSLELLGSLFRMVDDRGKLVPKLPLPLKVNYGARSRAVRKVAGEPSSITGGSPQKVSAWLH